MICNVNSIMMGLRTVLPGYDVAPDVYVGNSKKFIVFTYADERGASFGDDEELVVKASIQITVYSPKDYNYFQDKATIKNYLKQNGFENITYSSWVDKDVSGVTYLRHQVFSADCFTTE